MLCIMPLMSSCGMFALQKPRQVMYEWHDDGGDEKISVEIDLAKQIAIYKRGQRTIGWSYVCSGKEGHSTSPGNYAIMEKLPIKYSDRYGWISDASGKTTNGDATPKSPVPPGEHYSPAPMNQWMRITRYGVGLHAGDIPRPGEPASHGCIRVPREFAPILYEASEVGTPVKVTKGTDSGSIRAKLVG